MSADALIEGASPPEKLTTRERILKAASTVFAEQGVKGATTREIARVAEVNETTLFRHFQNKELLLKAVVEQSANTIDEALTGPGMSNGDLRKDLTYYARVSNAVLFEKEPIIRMFIGECTRQPDGARQIACTAWQPVRLKLIDYLKRAQDNGQVLPHLDPEQTVEVLVSSLMGGMLRRKMVETGFSPEAYLDTVLDVFIRGISPAQQPENQE
ncbi:TetR/AcrR family transcriptional regulator [Vampirovibrio sp.]|uniref:TetR/AcrR family transcriptional regulator n=1 Tax=Vampirovibrio sp. TaxID=2717857 RepID=UPI0035934916